MFDRASFEQKMQLVLGVLPSIGNLVLAAQQIAPAAAGLTKLGLVVNTVIAAEPLFVGMEQMLVAVVDGVVNQYYSASLLPPPAPAVKPTA